MRIGILSHGNHIEILPCISLFWAISDEDVRSTTLIIGWWKILIEIDWATQL